METLVEPVQVDVREERRDHSALRRPLLRPGALGTLVGLLDHRCFQPQANQFQHRAITDPHAQASHQLVVRDRIEVPLQVGVVHFPIARRQVRANRFQRLMGRTLRSESIGTIQEIRLEDRLQNQQRRRLHHAVFHRRDAQRTQLAVSLRNVHPPHRLRSVAFLLQLLLQFDQEIDKSRSLVVAAANDLLNRHAIDAGCSSVFRYLVPRRHQRVPPIDPIIQSVESKLRFLLGLLAQLVSQKREFRRHAPLLRSGIF